MLDPRILFQIDKTWTFPQTGNTLPISSLSNEQTQKAITTLLDDSQHLYSTHLLREYIQSGATDLHIPTKDESDEWIETTPLMINLRDKCEHTHKADLMQSSVDGQLLIVECMFCHDLFYNDKAVDILNDTYDFDECNLNTVEDMCNFLDTATILNDMDDETRKNVIKALHVYFD